MNWLKNKIGAAKVSMAVANAQEEALYEQAAAEMAEGNIRAGLWAKALSAADGDERKAKARYIAFRVEQMQLQLGAMGAVANAVAAPEEQAKRQPQPEHKREPEPAPTQAQGGWTLVSIVFGVFFLIWVFARLT